MNAATQAPIERMRLAEVETELTTLAETERTDALANERRDFKTEIENADDQRAAEISAEQTLYFGRKRRRAARREALETALKARQADDINVKLDSIAKAHSEALTAAKEALANIDVDALTALEQQVNDYLAAEAEVCKHALDAAFVARGAGAKAPGIESIHAKSLREMHGRLEKMKAHIASSSQRVSLDNARFGVPFGAI
jgi:multidrug efflux pump subunit AcrA (membrane-fusion protein)